MNKRKNAFTLVELVSVLVIMAVIAVIAIPLILTVINKAKAYANKRSVDAYGKAVELSVLSYLMDNGKYPTDLTTLSVEYSGKDVTCNVMNLNADGSIYLSECSVGNTEVRDDNADDGWYHYEKSESNNSSDSNTDAEVVVYNGIEFYTISSDEDSVTLLKAEPLTVDEVNTYGAGHVNMYSDYNTASETYQTAGNWSGYGAMAYYSSSTCGYATPGDDASYIESGCTSDYANSEVKYVLDSWSNALLNPEDLKIDKTGYAVRLITKEDLKDYLGYEFPEVGSIVNSTNGETPSWVYNENYWYWTMIPYTVYDVNVNVSFVRVVNTNGWVENYNILGNGYINGGVVRPVITLYKTAL